MQLTTTILGSLAAFAIFLCPCFGLDVVEGKAHASEKVEKSYLVEGMTCGGCEVAVKLSLKKAGFGKNIKSVSHKKGLAVLEFSKEEYTKDTDCKVINAIRDKGYLTYLDAKNKEVCKK